MTFEDMLAIVQPHNDKLIAEGRLAEAERQIEQLRRELLDSQRLSHEWMRKHDELLGFIQARPLLLKELIALNDGQSTHGKV